MKQRLIAADDVYERVLKLKEKSEAKRPVSTKYIEALNDALDEIEFSKTIEWRTDNEN